MFLLFYSAGMSQRYCTESLHLDSDLRAQTSHWLLNAVLLNCKLHLHERNTHCRTENLKNVNQSEESQEAELTFNRELSCQSQTKM